MIVAAARAASRDLTERWISASYSKAIRTSELRAAIAHARSKPYLVSFSNVSSLANVDKFRRTSLAKSGNRSFRLSIDILCFRVHDLRHSQSTKRIRPPSTPRLQPRDCKDIARQSA